MKKILKDKLLMIGMVLVILGIMHGGLFAFIGLWSYPGFYASYILTYWIIKDANGEFKVSDFLIEWDGLPTIVYIIIGTFLGLIMVLVDIIIYILYICKNPCIQIYNKYKDVVI